MQRIREKIVEQEAEHIKLVDENNKLKTEKQITVSELVVDSETFTVICWRMSNQYMDST